MRKNIELGISMSATAYPDERWHQVMTGLLYPAVLGAILFTFAERLADKPSEFSALTLGAGLAILVLFTFDYAHTMSGAVRETYGPSEFVCDALITTLLFLAGKRVLGAPVVFLELWALMALTKGASIAWEALRLGKGRAQDASIKVTVNFKADLVFGIVYVVLGLFFQVARPEFTWLLVVAMILDALVYIRLTAA